MTTQAVHHVDDTLTSNPPSKPLLTLYGKMLTFSRIKLHTNDISTIDQELEQLLDGPHTSLPVVIDSDLPQDLPTLVDVLWSKGLQPIGVVTGVLDEHAKAQKLAIFPPEGERIERVSSRQRQTHAQDSSGDLIHEHMLRSGQSINHVGGNLIITNSVNNGAEVITDHSLHIYGRAAGRLVAGATGDKSARIFCQQFSPALVSVAGTYCLQDSIPADVLNRPVQVSFAEGEGLKFQVMDESGTTAIVSSN